MRSTWMGMNGIEILFIYSQFSCSKLCETMMKLVEKRREEKNKCGQRANRRLITRRIIMQPLAC